MTNDELMLLASEARKNSYAVYSHFKVGAAILCDDENVYTGANVENSSYGCAVCAERAAAVKAVNDGKKNFLKIAVVGNTPETFPCGICRQFLSEFSPHMKIILKDKNNNISEYELSELMPHGFTLSGQGE